MSHGPQKVSKKEATEEAQGDAQAHSRLRENTGALSSAQARPEQAGWLSHLSQEPL